MIGWLFSNLGSVAVCAVIITLLALAIYRIVKKKTSCGCGCSCGCGDCPYSKKDK